MARIVCFGEALIDFLARPVSATDQPRAFLQHAGGAPANVAVAVARLGGDADFVGMLGTDMFGDFLLDSLRGAGVGTRHVRRTGSAHTALAFVSLDARGERSFSFYRPPAADLLFRDAHCSEDAFAAARVFHVCSNSLTEAEIAQTTLSGMPRAPAAGALVSFDLNLRPALWPPGEDPSPRLWSALAAADLVKLSAEELAFIAAPLSGETAAIARIWHGRARLLVVTDGAQPLRWFTPQRSGSMATFDVQAVDTTAAGDAFAGGLLHGIAAHGVDAASLPVFAAEADALGQALRFAAACGALAVTRTGAFAAMPRRHDVEALLRTPPSHPSDARESPAP